MYGFYLYVRVRIPERLVGAVGGLREGMVGGWGLFADDGGFLMFLQRGVEVTVSRYGG